MKTHLVTLLAFCTAAVLAGPTWASSANQNEVTSFVHHWFSLFDRNAPVQEFLPLLSDQDLTMHFPEQDLRSQQDFSEWYANILKTFRKASHRLESVTIQRSSARTYSIHVTVYWSAIGFDGKRTAMRAEQDWAVEKTSRGFVIRSYTVVPSQNQNPVASPQPEPETAPMCTCRGGPGYYPYPCPAVQTTCYGGPGHYPYPCWTCP